MITIVFLILAACGGGQSSQEVSNSDGKKSKGENKRVIRVGLNVGYVPWEFKEGNNLVGVEVDIISEAIKRLDKEPEWIATPWTGLFAGLLAQKFEVAAAGITIKPDRIKEMDFTSPYYDSDQSLTTKTGSGIESMEDMKGKVIGVESGTTGDQWVQDHKDEYKFSEIKLYNSLQDAMMDLEAGRIDGEVSDIPASLYYTKDKEKLKVVERIITNEKYGLAFRKGDTLGVEFNRVMDEMKKDGTMAKIYEKWFGEAPSEDSSTVTILPVPE
ncbi:hypothetical protein AA980_12820 [Neobacillus vireti]|nr:hypothetical protein AA980_12820 [Neobacillus vireti]